jgi:uncharacterized protein YecT (DUF1311 family)
MRYFSVLFALTLGSPALAADNCASQSSTHAINACAQQDYEAADRALNAEYAKLRARLPAAAKAGLLAEQRAWLKARDPNCRKELESEQGGTIWTSMYLACQAEATRERTQQLRKWKAEKP